MKHRLAELGQQDIAPNDHHDPQPHIQPHLNRRSSLDVKFCKIIKDPTMRGRMPYPVPTLAMMVVAILMPVTFSSLMKLCGSREKAHDSHVPSLPKHATNQDLPGVDPFSDVADVVALMPQTGDVRLTTKFAEIYSGSEELSFDWIVPFEQSTSKE